MEFPAGSQVEIDFTKSNNKTYDENSKIVKFLRESNPG
jgi:hypothetical protein